MHFILILSVSQSVVLSTRLITDLGRKDPRPSPATRKEITRKLRCLLPDLVEEQIRPCGNGEQRTVREDRKDSDTCCRLFGGRVATRAKTIIAIPVSDPLLLRMCGAAGRNENSSIDTIMRISKFLFPVSNKAKRMAVDYPAPQIVAMLLRVFPLLTDTSIAPATVVSVRDFIGVLLGSLYPSKTALDTALARAAFQGLADVITKLSDYYNRNKEKPQKITLSCFVLLSTVVASATEHATKSSTQPCQIVVSAAAPMEMALLHTLPVAATLIKHYPAVLEDLVSPLWEACLCLVDPLDVCDEVRLAAMSALGTMCTAKPRDGVASQLLILIGRLISAEDAPLWRSKAFDDEMAETLDALRLKKVEEISIICGLLSTQHIIRGFENSHSDALRVALCYWECLALRLCPERVPNAELLLPFVGEEVLGEALVDLFSTAANRALEEEERPTKRQKYDQGSSQNGGNSVLSDDDLLALMSPTSEKGKSAVVVCKLVESAQKDLQECAQGKLSDNKLLRALRGVCVTTRVLASADDSGEGKLWRKLGPAIQEAMAKFLGRLGGMVNKNRENSFAACSILGRIGYVSYSTLQGVAKGEMLRGVLDLFEAVLKMQPMSLWGSSGTAAWAKTASLYISLAKVLPRGEYHEVRVDLFRNALQSTNVEVQAAAVCALPELVCCCGADAARALHGEFTQLVSSDNEALKLALSEAAGLLSCATSGFASIDAAHGRIWCR